MRTAVQSPSDDRLDPLERRPVSDVKRDGWRGIMKTVDAAGTVLMTNHDKPEAVIMSLREYRQLIELAKRVQHEDQQRLERLTREFDAELALLRQPDAADRLREAFNAPLALDGKVLAGRSY